MYVNKIENIITFKIKTRYYIKLLVPETMTLLGNTKKKITKGRKWSKCTLFRNYERSIRTL